MPEGVTERSWFRWSLAAAFLIMLFAASWLYSPEHMATSVSPDERLADYTEALAGFTALLAIVSALQAWLLIRADNTSKRVLDLSEKQFLMEGQQADLAAKQHGLARLQHIAANKPRLRIRSVVVARSGPDGSGCMFRKGLMLTGNLVVANVGATDAIITESDYRFYWSRYGLPMRPPIGEGDPIKPLHGPEDQTIRAFESCSYGISCDEPLEEDVQATSKGGGTKLYIMGSIRYADIDGRERFMGFCREYVPSEIPGGEGHFVPVENGDYEFED